MADVTIRPATPEDARVIAQIHVASWQDAYRGILLDDALDKMTPNDRLPMWKRILAAGNSPMHVSVAEVDGHIAGFSSIGPSNEGDPDDVRMLYTIYLHPGMMRRGIGSALLIDAETRMREHGSTTGVLRVITGNDGTRRFYERSGWAIEPGSSRMEDAWGIQVETVRYRKHLGP